MGSIIKARTISSVVDNRGQLSNSSCARQWGSSIGTGWTKIRVAARYSITDSGANLTSTPRFAFGIQSGASSLFLAEAGPTNWCGIYTGLATWEREAGPPMRYRLINPGNLISAKKVGTTFTSGTSLTSSSGTAYTYFVGTAADIRSVIFLDITKGSPNYTFSCFRRVAISGAVDVSLATFLAQAILETPSVADHSYQGTGFDPTSVTQAVDETAGSFNSVGIAWDHSDALMELSEVFVVRFS